MSLNSSLLKLKLLDAIRLDEIDRLNEVSSQLDDKDKNTVLHYAVQVGTINIIKYVVDTGVDVNHRDSNGNTPLHLAAHAARIDVVKYLLSLPNINDTILNYSKLQPVELSADTSIAQLMQIERAKYVESVANNLRIYFLQRNFKQLDQLLTFNPRSSQLLDINGADPITGNTVFHEFILANDIEMCSWILNHGGDPLKRDKLGNLPIDLVKKNDDLKKIIKDAMKESTINIESSNSIISSNSTKGYLRKWTNFASGYKLRYFVLENGILSYYSSQDDTSNACRGSLNLGYATLHLDSSEKLKFEIIGKNNIRWHLKANHPTETNRWVWSLQNSATLAKDNLKKRNQNDNEKNHVIEKNNLTESHSDINSEKSHKHHLKIPGRKSKHKRDGSNASAASIVAASGVAGVAAGANANLGLVVDQSDSASKISRNSSTPANIASLHDNYSYDAENFDRDEDDDDDDSDIENFGTSNTKELLSTIKRSLNVEINSLQELFQYYNLDTTDPSRKQEICSAGLNTTSVIQDLINKYENLVISRDIKLNRQLERQLEVNKLWENSISQLENEIKKREIKLSEYEGKKQKLKKYLSKSGSTTPNNLGVGGLIGLDTTVKKDIDNDDPNKFVNDLLQDSDGDEFFDAGEFDDDDFDTRSAAPSVLSMSAPVPFPGQHEEVAKDATENYESKQDHVAHPVTQSNEEPASGEVEIPEVIHEVPEKRENVHHEAQEQSHREAPVQSHAPAHFQQEQPREHADREESHRQHSEESVDRDDPLSQGHHGAPIAAGVAAGVAGGVAGGAAIGAAHGRTEQQTPQTQAPQKQDSQQSQPKQEETKQSSAPSSKQVLTEGLNEAQAKYAQVIADDNTFIGYEDPPRTKLAMDEDNRPKVGLWGILKSMIGKDMSKMTLPVAFNEPTSLLQRLSEDIECSYLLDKAATFDDSTLRMIYVAAFAASEYASASGRIAKPFNPLLGETFEYCRPELNYRLLTEQVSHHPPISACAVQAPKWDYYGENAVDSKFTGRAFDIKHLGKMFCALRPDNGSIDTKGNKVVEELYSWKKVNTAVVGIITGSPTVDNYGLMEVTNHTTGDTIAVDLKQRGWKASSAYQLSGHSVDKKGVPQWAIGGRWNSKIYGKKIKSGNNPDKARRNSLLEEQPKVTSEDPYSGQKFLVWQVAPRPKVPFNLTAFATTLNDPNPNLVKWVAPTDTRLRPDQRAMEEGEYDKASTEKNRVEEKQRAAKKARDAKKEVYKPQWFVKKKHPITGDNFWEFQGNYWKLRGQQQLKDVGDIF